MTGAKPDFADQNIVKLQGILSRDLDPDGISRQDRIEGYHPVSLRVGFGGFRLRRNGHRDLLARIGRAPEPNRHIALEDHVIAKNRGAFHIRLGGAAHEKQSEQAEGATDRFQGSLAIEKKM